MAQNEPFLLARFEPKYLAQTDRNTWHKTNRIIHLSQSLPNTVFAGMVSVNGIVSKDSILHHPQLIAETVLNLYHDRSVLEVSL